MAYQVEMISELDGLSLGSGAEIIDKYISTKNCTALLIGVQCLHASAVPTQPLAAAIHTKLGTVEIVVSNKDGGGSQVSIDAADIPPLMEKIYGKPMPGIIGTNTNNRYQHFQYFLPLSPDPWSPKFGYRDARVKFKTGTDAAATDSDTYKLYVAAILHDEMPQYYIQMLNNSYTATSGVNKDLDIPESGVLMGAYAMGTTSLDNLTSSDAPTINELALVVNNTERSRINTRTIHAFTPTGVYMVAGVTPTSTYLVGSSEYVFWDLGFRRGYGVHIGHEWKLRIKPQASNAVRMYPLVAMGVR
jgi:hypothetical protein